MKSTALTFMGFAVVAAGCAPWKYTDADSPSGPSSTGQTYKDAVVMTCDVDRLAEVDPAEPDDFADVKRMAYLESHIDNGDGIYLRTMLSVRFGEARASLLEEAREQVGLDTCDLGKKAAAEATPEK